MSTLPAAGSFLFQGPSVTNTSRGPLFEQWLAHSAQLPGGAARQTLAMASGSITPLVALVTVDTQGAAAAGNLDAIQQTNLPAGGIVVLHSADPARVVTVRHNQGSAPAKILLTGGSNLVLNNTSIALMLEATASGWVEILRWPGNSTATWQSVTGNGAAAALGVAAFADVQAGSSATLAVTPSTFRSGILDRAWYAALTAASAAVAAGNTLLLDDGTGLRRAGVGKILGDLGVPRTPFDSGIVDFPGGSTKFLQFNHGLGAVPRLTIPRVVAVPGDSSYTTAGTEISSPSLHVYASTTFVGVEFDSPVKLSDGLGGTYNANLLNFSLRVRAFL